MRKLTRQPGYRLEPGRCHRAAAYWNVSTHFGAALTGMGHVTVLVVEPVGQAFAAFLERERIGLGSQRGEFRTQIEPRRAVRRRGRPGTGPDRLTVERALHLGAPSPPGLGGPVPGGVRFECRRILRRSHGSPRSSVLPGTPTTT